MRKISVLAVLMLSLNSLCLLGQTITCPSDMTIYNTSAPFQPIIFYSVTTTDNFLGVPVDPPTPTLDSGLPSGSMFPYGTTINYWRADFACDALFHPVCELTCHFSITVLHPIVYYRDYDGDGVGDPNHPINGTNVTPAGYVLNGSDCNDSDATVWRSTTLYKDNDGDGYNDGTISVCWGDTWPYGTVVLGSTVVFKTPPGYSLTTNGPDCNDNDPTVWQSKTLYIDNDGDGYDNGTATVCYGASVPAGYSLTTNGPDCNDNDASINPASQWVLDADGDGYYTGGIVTQCTSPGTGYVLLNGNQTAGDCNDHDATMHASFSFYKDNDGDGYGADSIISGVCAVNANTPPTGYSTNNTDCDDNANAVWGLVTEYIDKDHDGYDAGSITVCAGIIDPFELSLAGYSLSTKGPDCDDNNAAINPATVWYKDADGDGYGDGTTQTQCARPTGYKLASELTATSGDCDDNNAAINPATVWYKDADGDGYSDGTTKLQCTRPTGYKLASELIATSGDCDDNNALLKPTTVWYKDADNDGYSSGATLTQCLRQTGYKLASELIATSGDCNDNDPGINPGAVEVCNNKVDDNCNGVVDEKSTCYPCQNGTNLTTTNITSTSATFNWSATANPQQWHVQYKTTAPGGQWVDVPLLFGNVRAVTISPLLANQTYHWQISAKCNGSWTSYSDAVIFKTAKSGGAISSITATTLNNPTLKLYPNPNKGNFLVELNVLDKINANATIQLIDMTGKTVQMDIARINNGALQKTIHVSPALAEGLYMVRILVNDTVYKTQMIYAK